MNDQQRCEHLYRPDADRVHAYARRRSDLQSADEIVAEVFLGAWRRLDAVPADALPWLLAVARRTLANQFRTISRASALTERIKETLARVEPQGEGDQGVLAALAELDPGDQELLLLIAWEGAARGGDSHGAEHQPARGRNPTALEHPGRTPRTGQSVRTGGPAGSTEGVPPSADQQCSACTRASAARAAAA